MNVATITMPADEARDRYHEYTKALRGREASDEDRGIMLGYKAIATGKSLLNLVDVMRRCPANAKGQPALAVARVHWRHVRLETSSGGACRFYRGRDYVYSGLRVAWHEAHHVRRWRLAGTVP